MMNFQIANRNIGPGFPPFVIAELSGNHNGDIERAKRLIQSAKSAGADAVKLQTYTADTITIDHNSDDFLIKGGPWKDRCLYDLYKEAHTPWDWHEVLFQTARDEGIIAFSSPFDSTAIDFLESFDVPAYKIASFECIDLPLIRYAASKGKPLIISTGMATMVEVAEAVEAAKSAGAPEIALLHCVSAYPAESQDYNLSTIPRLAQKFNCQTGLSDHTLGTVVATAAVALGAKVIEKHITLARSDGGPDAAFSLEPEELETLVTNVRQTYESVGSPRIGVLDSEKGSMVFRRSLYVVKDIKAGEVFTTENVRSIRPGYGLPPKYIDELIGKKAAVSIQRGTALCLEMIN